jgi:predicted RNase H-like nuclease (RuvC/YqgF family)
LKIDPDLVVERVVEGFIERARSARGRDRERLSEKARKLHARLSELQRSLEELERELAKP